MHLRTTTVLLVVLAFGGAAGAGFPDEPYLANIQQLTTGGSHTRPALSADGKSLVFTGRGEPYGMPCDQVYRLNLLNISETPIRISPGFGVATGARFIENTGLILMQANLNKVTFDLKVNLTAGQTCPTHICDTANAPAACQGAHWRIYTDSDVFSFNPYGNIHEQRTDGASFDAVITLSVDNEETLYFSHYDENGVNIFVNSSTNNYNISQVTFFNSSAFAAGAAVSADGNTLVYHAVVPSVNDTGFSATLNQSLANQILPTSTLQVYQTGANLWIPRPLITPVNSTSYGPVFASADGSYVIFTQTAQNDVSRLVLYNLLDDTSLPLSTLQPGVSTFDAFVSVDFKTVVFVSNRTSQGSQVFVADLVLPESNSSTPSTLRRVSTNAAEAPACWKDKETVPYDNIVHYENETAFKNVKQLTFGGENAEGYFSFDNNWLTIQAEYYGTNCDQIYRIDLCKDPGEQLYQKSSTGIGVCTCSFIFPDNKHSLYAGTFKSVTFGPQMLPADETCPVKACHNPVYLANATFNKTCSEGAYLWDIYPEYDIYKVNEYGVIVQQLTNTPGYDAEGVISPDGKLIAFTSIRSGDLELHVMNLDGTGLRQVTFEEGYDGGSFFSPDSKRLIFRASRPKTKEELEEYRMLLAFNVVKPTKMELFVVDLETNITTQLTDLGVASWAPYYLPNNKQVIFSSNYNTSANAFEDFALWVCDDDGVNKNLARVTMGYKEFASFPMFSFDGKKLVFGSTRNQSSMYDINLFITDWVGFSHAGSAAPAWARLFIFALFIYLL